MYIIINESIFLLFLNLERIELKNWISRKKKKKKRHEHIHEHSKISIKLNNITSILTIHADFWYFSHNLSLDFSSFTNLRSFESSPINHRSSRHVFKKRRSLSGINRSKTDQLFEGSPLCGRINSWLVWRERLYRFMLVICVKSRLARACWSQLEACLVSMTLDDPRRTNWRNFSRFGDRLGETKKLNQLLNEVWISTRNRGRWLKRIGRTWYICTYRGIRISDLNIIGSLVASPLLKNILAKKEERSHLAYNNISYRSVAK